MVMPMVRAVPSEALLQTWEQAYGLDPAAKGVALLGLAMPQRSFAELLRMTLGQRDGALLTLRRELFGEDLTSVAACPACGDHMELSFRVDDIRVPPAEEHEVTRRLTIGDVEFAARAPTCDDLLAIQHLPLAESRRSELIRRCIRTAHGEPPDRTFSVKEIRMISATMAECDPQADVTVAVECTSCERSWSSRFDVVQFLWREIDAWAQRLLTEVHVLASAYGWQERAVLALSPWRRQIYLEMLRQ
jgi:hypothetical protein